MHLRLTRALLSCLLAALIAGCAAVPSPLTTTTWRDPDFRGPPFRKVFVIGLNSQSLTDQRGFENAMVAALQRAGVDAVPGWQYVPTDRTPDQAVMRAAVAQSGADAALLVRMSGFTTETSIGYGAGGVVAAGPNMYVGWYEPGLVTSDYQAATIYTTLFDVRTARPVWTFNPPAYSPAAMQQEAPRFAYDVAGMLQSAGLIGGP